MPPPPTSCCTRACAESVSVADATVLPAADVCSDQQGADAGAEAEAGPAQQQLGKRRRLSGGVYDGRDSELCSLPLPPADEPMMVPDTEAPSAHGAGVSNDTGSKAAAIPAAAACTFNAAALLAGHAAEYTAGMFVLGEG